MSKYISTEKAIQGVQGAMRRFPMALFVAFCGTIIGILSIHTDYYHHNILMALALGFPFFVAVGLFGEQRAWKFKQKIIVNGVALGFLAVYYVWLPENVPLNSYNSFAIRFVVWEVCFALLITFVLFLQRRNEKSIGAFWQYNWQMVFSFILTVFWAVALQAGLSIAMKSVDFLFNIHVSVERYLELWIVLVGIFSTTFFLARVPKIIEIFQEQDAYTKELRLFSQYVLVPLVVLYFLILYAYVVRILIFWEWPNGTLAYMILGFSFLGVIAYVCLYPFRKKSAWVRRAGNVFYTMLIPQIGMLFWALWFRISEYGFTEKRYFVFVFGWWLLVIGVYFLASKAKDIRIIPSTIFVVAFLASFGPWGAFAVSERSQVNRLEKILTRNDLLSGGIMRRAEFDNNVPFADKKEIGAIIRYLQKMHDLRSIQPWFSADLADLKDKDGRSVHSGTAPKFITEDLIGIQYLESWMKIGREKNRTFHFARDYSATESPFRVAGYDYIANLSGTSDLIGTIEGAIYRFVIDEKNNFVLMRDGQEIARTDLYEGFLDVLIKDNYFDHLAGDKMKAVFQNDDISFVIHFTTITGDITDDETYKINSIDAKMLFSLKASR